MKRFILFSVAMLVCISAGAQRFSCNFTLLDKETGTVLAAGQAYVQGGCYRFETSDGTLFCDGNTRWIYSHDSDELVIENNVTPVIPDADLNKIQECPGYMVVYDKYKINLSNIKKVSHEWEASFFTIGSNLIGEDTIVTDMR